MCGVDSFRFVEFPIVLVNLDVVFVAVVGVCGSLISFVGGYLFALMSE